MLRTITWMFGGAVALVLSVAAIAQEGGWTVPEEARVVENPVVASPEVLEAGKALYDGNCQKCHGDTGAGDGPATKYIKPAPADITGTATQDRMTDGEIFFKITQGKRPMPPMGAKLTDEERWTLVHYVRSLREAP